MKLLRVLFKKDPPMGKWIDYGEYQVRWRRHWASKVEITAYNRQKDKIQLRLLSPEEITERENREYSL